MQVAQRKNLKVCSYSLVEPFILAQTITWPALSKEPNEVLKSSLKLPDNGTMKARSVTNGRKCKDQNIKYIGFPFSDCRPWV